MTITIDAWTVWPMILILLGFGVGLYEYGQRKGLETAEKLYSPLLDKIAEHTILSVEECK